MIGLVRVFGWFCAGFLYVTPTPTAHAARQPAGRYPAARHRAAARPPARQRGHGTDVSHPPDNRRSGGTRPDELMCRHVFPPPQYRSLRGTKTSGTRFPGGCLLARTSNKGVGRSHLGNPDSNKEKQIWLISEKKTKARGNNRKKPSVI